MSLRTRWRGILAAVLTVAALCTGLALAVSSPATGSTGPAAHAVTVAPAHLSPAYRDGRRCNESTSARLWTSAGNVIGAETKWADNGCIEQQRVHIDCIDSNLHTWIENGGWVYSTAIWSSRLCGGSGHPNPLAVWADVQWRLGPGQTVHTSRFWPSSSAQLTAYQQVQRADCVAPWDGAKRITPGVFEADWEGQNCSFYLQAKARCEGRFNGEKNYYSGIVKANELEDVAGCSRDRPVLVEGSINFREDGFWIGWCEVWPDFKNCHT